MKRARAPLTGLTLAALAFMAGVALPLSAQKASLITGTVKNAVTGDPVANATVSVAPGKRSYVTGGDGRY
ncbi:MAG TPA: hypothetical protein VKO87_00495, partial [Gemmatimonadaceae bacterium]|nr:hypothetical protein [Gemmatimonadaceae bacterium]